MIWYSVAVVTIQLTRCEDVLTFNSKQGGTTPHAVSVSHCFRNVWGNVEFPRMITWGDYLCEYCANAYSLLCKLQLCWHCLFSFLFFSVVLYVVHDHCWIAPVSACICDYRTIRCIDIELCYNQSQYLSILGLGRGHARQGCTWGRVS